MEDTTDTPAGTNYESSFETEIIARTTGCQVWAYDSNRGAHGPRVDWANQNRVHFQRFGLASIDAHGPNDSPKSYTLETLMAANGTLSLPLSLSLQHSTPCVPLLTARHRAHAHRHSENRR